MELTRNLTITNELGLHARTAAKIARLAEEANDSVYIIKDGRQVDATDILDIMGLYCPRGTQIILRIVNPADMKVLDHIAEQIKSGFGES